MQNLRSLDAVRLSVMSEAPGCCLPLYGTYCFSEIAGTAASLLGSRMGWNRLPEDCLPEGVGRVRRVVLVLVDALGWSSVEDFDHGLLALFRDEGVASQLTSQFPSTTSACVPTLATGKAVGENGVYEWWMYLPEAGDLICPLTFSYREVPRRRGSLLERGVVPSQVFTNPSIYSLLDREGIPSATVSPKWVNGPTEEVLKSGATGFPYDSLQSLQARVRQARATEARLINIYVDDFDRVCHDEGPTSPGARRVRDAVLRRLEGVIRELRDGNTLFLLFADHGQVDVNPRDPARCITLDAEFPQIVPMLERSSGGEPLPMAGALRDAFLHIRPEEAARACDLLKAGLDGRALVYNVRELIDRGLFGPIVSDAFRSRVGNIVVLPHRDQVVAWSNHATTRDRFKGDHGGLTRDEMEVPFLALL